MGRVSWDNNEDIISDELDRLESLPLASKINQIKSARYQKNILQQ